MLSQADQKPFEVHNDTSHPLSQISLTIPPPAIQGQAVRAINKYRENRAQLTDHEEKNVPGESIDPKLNDCNKALCDDFGRMTINLVKEALSSKKAAINNVSVAAASLANAIITTTSQTPYRLQIVAGSELFLYAGMITADLFCQIYGEKEAVKKLEDAFKMSGAFCNGFAFTYAICCEVAAAIPGANIYAVMGIVFGLSLAAGLFRAYGQTQKFDTALRPYINSFSFGLGMGSILNNIFRICNDALPSNDDYSSTVKLAFQLAPATLTAAGSYAWYRFNKQAKISEELATFSNFLYDVGSDIQAINPKTKDSVAIGCSNTKIFLGYGGAHCLIQLIKLAFKILKKEPESESLQLLRVPLLESEDKEDSSTPGVPPLIRTSSNSVQSTAPASSKETTDVDVNETANTSFRI